MQVTGIVIHHSECPSINGKGYDFFVTKSGAVIPCAEPPGYDKLHVCLEGNFSRLLDQHKPELVEQLFVASKLIYRLCTHYDISRNDIIPHNADCPGDHFPWGQLVISITDMYH